MGEEGGVGEGFWAGGGEYGRGQMWVYVYGGVGKECDR